MKLSMKLCGASPIGQDEEEHSFVEDILQLLLD